MMGFLAGIACGIILVFFLLFLGWLAYVHDEGWL